MVIILSTHVSRATDWVAEAWIAMGDLAQQHSSWRVALVCYSRAARATPNDPETWLKKGELLAEMGIPAQVLCGDGMQWGGAGWGGVG